MPPSLKIVFDQEEYDLLVIGGGINGCAIANVAAGQGMSVALVEKEDFAGGTSSKTTKLIHGGLRYLEYFEFDLVAESLRERAVQLKNVPHLVKPLKFIIPVYRKDRRPLWMMRLGVFLYDFLSGPYVIEKHRSLTADEVLASVPGIEKEGLVGGVCYADARMDDARLCLENILSARTKGADAANYTAVKSLLKINGKVVGATLRNVLNGGEITVKARKVVAAVGPWTNVISRMDLPMSPPRIRMTKGVHLIYEKRISDTAVLLQSGRDNRIFFVIPFENHSLIGTTDTDYDGDPDTVEADAADIEYLLEGCQKFFPGVTLKREEIVATFAGLRPLVFAPGSPSAVSRNHVITESYSGMVYVMGGKYTTYRKIAIDCVNKIREGKPVDSAMTEYPLFGSGAIEQTACDVAQQSGLPERTVEYLMAKYGTRYHDVLKVASRDKALLQPICACSPAIMAQVVYAFETEMARTADDVIWRRLGLGYLACKSKSCRKIIEEYSRKSGVVR